jgi:hypothetical protein
MFLTAACVSEQYADPVGIFRFKSDREKQETERRALAGDNQAARRMAEYCDFIEENRIACLRWYKLAASRGDKIAKHNLKILQEPQ